MTFLSSDFQPPTPPVSTIENQETHSQLSRRNFLKGMLMAGSGLALLPWMEKAHSTPQLNQSLISDAQFWAQPRMLHLYRSSNGEAVQTCYWANGQLYNPGYTQICWLLRDVKARQWTYMDPRLLDLLCAIQAWVKQYHYTQPLHIHSGFRTLQTNQGLEGAAKNSMHLHAKAVDFTMPGLPWQYVGKLAAHYAAGGVGFYPSAQFIHVDTGRLRYWVNK